jgi:hypothetical protein
VSPPLAPRPTIIALLIAAVPGLVACGEDEEETFREEFRPLNDRIVELGGDVDKAVTGASGKSDQQIEQEFGRLARRTGAVRTDLGELEPPDDLADDQQDLVEALGDARDALNEIEQAAGEGDPQAARRATIQLVAASSDVGSERRRLARATGAKQ